MGHRANLILGNRQGYELYYAHWRANTLDSDLFWGPEAAIAFIRRQRSVSEGAGWLDEVWAEGGAVVDPDARRVLFFGGEDILFDAPLRRVHLALMQELWLDWKVEWAHGHLCELALYVGRDADDLLDVDEAWLPELREPEEPSWISSVLSAQRADGSWKLHAFDADIANVALAGPGWVPRFLGADLPAEYDYAARSDSFPTGGLHIDEAHRRVEVWLAPPKGAFEERLRAAWPGWDVRWHHDHFEGITAQIGSRLRLPWRSEDELVNHVRSIVLRPPEDRSDLVRELSSRRGENVEINPFALRDDPSYVSTTERTRRFALAVDAWRRGHPRATRAPRDRSLEPPRRP